MTLLKRIHEDWLTHNKAWTRAGFHAIAVYRIGAWHQHLPRPLRLPVNILYRVLYVLVRNVYGIELPYTVKVGRRVVIAHQSGITIHRNATIGDDCHIRQNVTIGVAIGRWDESATIGDRVSLGAGAVIVGKVHIGDGAHIGPNVVVMTNIPAGATVIGPSPRIIGPSRGPARPARAVAVRRRTGELTGAGSVK